MALVPVPVALVATARRQCGAGFPRPYQRHRHRQHRRRSARCHRHRQQPGADSAAGAGQRRRRATSASSRFRPGVYDVTFELSGFQTVKREGIRVVINQTLTVDQQLQVATLQETVTVTGESPVVDTSSTGVGTNFTKELLTEIPNARDIWAAMSQAPGISMQAYDVGGSHAGTQTDIRHLRRQRAEPDEDRGHRHHGRHQRQRGLLRLRQLRRALGRRRRQQRRELRRRRRAGDHRQIRRRSLHRQLVQRLGRRRAPSATTCPTPSGPPTRVTTTASSSARRSRAATRSIASTTSTSTSAVRSGSSARGCSTAIVSTTSTSSSSNYPDLARSKLTNDYTFKGTFQLNRNNQIIGFLNKRNKLQDKRDIGPTTPLSASRYQASRNYPMKVEWTSVMGSRHVPRRAGRDAGRISSRSVRRTKPASTPARSCPAASTRANNQRFDGGGHDSYQNQKRWKPQFYAAAQLLPGRMGGQPRFQVRLRLEERSPGILPGSALRPLLPGPEQRHQSDRPVQLADRADQRSEVSVRLDHR